jgi:hypothetical protein
MKRLKKTVKELHITIFLNSAKARAKRDSVPFSLTREYLLSIATDVCPVFHTPFEWGRSGLGIGKFKTNCPTLDRIEPSLGYVEGNVAFISHRANRLKDNGTMQEHYDIADWIWTHLYAKPNTTAPIPKRTNLKGIDNSQSGTSVTPGTRQDDNDSHHHCGADAREDLNYSPQASSGNSMGQRSEEVGTSKIIESLKNYGQPRPTYEWLEY